MAPPGEPPAEELPRRVLQTPSFSVNVHEILTRTGCTDAGCHGIGQAGLTLSSDVFASYAELVDVPSESEPRYFRVEPFNADSSYVVIKLEGRQRVGGEMPPGLPLDSIDLMNIRNWIQTGAPNN